MQLYCTHTHTLRQVTTQHHRYYTISTRFQFKQQQLIFWYSKIFGRNCLLFFVWWYEKIWRKNGSLHEIRRRLSLRRCEIWSGSSQKTFDYVLQVSLCLLLMRYLLVCQISCQFLFFFFQLFNLSHETNPPFFGSECQFQVGQRRKFLDDILLQHLHSQAHVLLNLWRSKLFRTKTWSQQLW